MALQRRRRPTVKVWRVKCGLTQRQAAEILGLSTLFISHVECGIRIMSPPVRLLIRIFEAYPQVMRDRMAELKLEAQAAEE